MKKEKGMSLIAFVLIIILILLIGGGAIFIFTKEEKPVENSNNKQIVEADTATGIIVEGESETNNNEVAVAKLCNGQTVLGDYYLNISFQDAGISLGKNIVIPENVIWNGKKYTIVGINSNCFAKNNDIEIVTLPDTIERIEEKAFYQCLNLSKINVPKNLKYIGSYAFAGCQSLTDILFTNQILAIKDCAFSTCKSLETLDLSNCEIYTISDTSFAYCTNLKSVLLPETVKTIETFAFNGCTSLSEIKLPQNVSTIGSAIISKDQKTTLIVTKGSKAEQYAIKNNFNYKY